MSQQTQDSDSAEFGPNQWLVDALREQWREDPSSVDPSWAEYFSTHTVNAEPSAPPESSSSTDSPSSSSETSTTTPPKSSESSPVAQEQDASAAKASAAKADPPPAQPAEAASAAASPAQSSPSSPSSSSAAAPASASQPAKESPAVNDHPAKSASKAPAVSTTSDRPAKVPTTTSQIPAVELREPEVVKLRGPAAAIVRNMAESLEVPTATSVRDVPVKLLFDNRIVINNHLKRHRAGKVSFTHLIGWAMIEAITEINDMNNGF
ncbi:MAG: 2-oxoglutarate dehydrogenase E1 subunit family protein, partial [Brachybacterium sp.]